MKKIIPAILCSAFLAMSCHNQTENDAPATRQSGELANVVGESLTVEDFERTQVWLPSFARQLDSNANVEISRFWSLVELMRIAQDAKQKNLLSPARRSLAIKTALAEINISRLEIQNRYVSDGEIQNYQNQHPEQFLEKPQFTVNFALLKNDARFHEIAIGYYFAHSAQLGYNFTNPLPRPKTEVRDGIEPQNRQGRFIKAHNFAYVFTSIFTENSDTPRQIGPFSPGDGLRFSCPAAISVLQNTAVNTPIPHDISCSGNWKAFVIPKWRKNISPMDPDKARQLAVEKILARRRIDEVYDIVSQKNIPAP